MKFDKQRFRRACRGVKQKDLAPVLGINQSNVSKLMRNLERIQLTDFLKICEYLEEEPTRFFIKE